MECPTAQKLLEDFSAAATEYVGAAGKLSNLNGSHNHDEFIAAMRYAKASSREMWSGAGGGRKTPPRTLLQYRGSKPMPVSGWQRITRRDSINTCPLSRGILLP